MQSSFSDRIAIEMEQGASPRAGEKTTNKTQTHSHMKEDQEASGMISALRAGEKTTNKTQTHSHMKEDQEASGMISALPDSVPSDSDASNGKGRKETQPPSSEIDSNGGHNSDKKLGPISPSLPAPEEHESKNNSEGDHDTQEEEQQQEKEGEEVKGREMLQRHRVEVAGQVWIPEIWGQEELLKDWVDCSAFEASMAPTKIYSAKAALTEEGKKAKSGGLRIDKSC